MRHNLQPGCIAAERQGLCVLVAFLRERWDDNPSFCRGKLALVQRIVDDLSSEIAYHRVSEEYALWSWLHEAYREYCAFSERQKTLLQVMQRVGPGWGEIKDALLRAPKPPRELEDGGGEWVVVGGFRAHILLRWPRDYPQHLLARALVHALRTPGGRMPDGSTCPSSRVNYAQKAEEARLRLKAVDDAIEAGTVLLKEKS